MPGAAACLGVSVPRASEKRERKVYKKRSKVKGGLSGDRGCDAPHGLLWLGTVKSKGEAE